MQTGSKLRLALEVNIMPMIKIQAEEWIQSFLSLESKEQGYQRSNVTVYKHILAKHVPDMIREDTNIKQFSCQGG